MKNITLKYSIIKYYFHITAERGNYFIDDEFCF